MIFYPRCFFLLFVFCLISSLSLSAASSKFQIPFERVFSSVSTESVDEFDVYDVNVNNEEGETMADSQQAFSVLHKRDVSKFGLSGSYVRYLTNVDVVLSSTSKTTFRTIIDTGNSLTAFPVSGCVGCSTRNVLLSNQTSPVFCSSPECDGRCSATTPLLCEASQVLSNGIVLRGYRTRGNVALGNLTASLNFQAIELQQERDPVPDLSVEGVLSFGHVDETSTRVLPTFFDVISSKYNLPKVFSLTLTNITGILTLGGTDDSITGPYYYTDMLLPSNATWEISVQSLVIGSTALKLNQRAQIESSSATIQMGDSLYQALQDLLQKSYPDLPGINGTTSIWNSLCFPNTSHVADYPPIVLGFLLDGFSLTLSPFDYFVPVVDKTNSTVYCFGISRGGEGLYLGDPFLRAFSTAFDEGKQRIGFALASTKAAINILEINDDDGGLSKGQKVAIAIGVIAGVALIIGVAIFVLKPKSSGGAVSQNNEKMLY